MFGRRPLVLIISSFDPIVNKPLHSICIFLLVVVVEKIRFFIPQFLLLISSVPALVLRIKKSIQISLFYPKDKHNDAEGSK